MTADRRDLLAAGGVASATTGCSRPAPPSPPNGKPDYTLRIGTGTVELAPDQIVSTIVYNSMSAGEAQGGPVAMLGGCQTMDVDFLADQRRC